MNAANDIKGYRTTYADLFEIVPKGTRPIEGITIPRIQRDYAQGRTDAKVEEIRDHFLEALLDAVESDQPVGLDFVYGKVDEDGAFHPLDGQQRLTTLFLLHWYFASAAGEFEPAAPWTRFSYETRASARLFCQRLVQQPLPPYAGRPSEWIIDQTWYLQVWRNDPTIQAMLVMIDAIDVERRRRTGLDASTAWDRLNARETPAIWFHLLPLDDMRSDEDLYIKMNSRGKPLTEFEAFKARFEQDIGHSNRAREFAQKVDGTWSDVFWPFRRGDDANDPNNETVDDELIRYVDYITELCELQEGRNASGRLGHRAAAVFGEVSERSPENLAFLIDAFDAWEGEDIDSVFEGLFSIALPGDEHYDSKKVPLFGATTSNLFEQCIHRFDSRRTRNREFTLQQGLLLYGVLLHRLRETQHFPQRLRVLRNLVAASDNEIRREYMPELLTDVEAIVVRGALDDVRRFNRNQVKDETLKSQFLKDNPTLASDLRRLEDHSILRGTLSAFELDAAVFADRARAFETAFAEPDSWLALNAALLTTGDYQRRRPGSDAWQFGSSVSDRETVWRYLLTNAGRDDLAATRTVLGRFLDGVAAAADESFDVHLAEVTKAWLAEREDKHDFDWRYYLVKYPAMREGATGIYYGIDRDGSYVLRMLRTKTLGGKHRDPFLLQVWMSSGVGTNAEDPWFRYDWDMGWLRLIRSGVGMRSMASGFALDPPSDEAMAARFAKVCARRGDVVEEDGVALLRVPQEDRGGELIDTVDRVQVGAGFLKELVDADL